MTLSRLKRLLKNYREIMVKVNRTTGSILKHYRVSNELTLEEVASGVCSISYLCKAENDKLIPSESIMQKMMEKLSIKEEDLYDTYNDDWVSEIIDNPRHLIKLLEQNKNKKDYKTKLINFANIIVNGYDKLSAHEAFMDLSNYFANFREEEMCLMLYLVLVLCDKEERYYDMLAISEEFYTFQRNQDLVIKVKILELKAMYKLGVFAQIGIYYNETINLMVSKNVYEDISYAIKYHLAFIAKTKDSDILRHELEKYQNIPENALTYINFCHQFFYKKDYEQALVKINKIKDLNDHYFLMSLLTLYKQKRRSDLIHLVNENQMPLRDSYKYVVQFLIENVDGQVDLIRSHILSSYLLVEEKDIAEFIYEESYRLFKERFLYKECTHLLEKYNRVLKQSAGFSLLNE